MKVIAIMREKGQYEDKVRYEFESTKEARQFIKAMIGILVCDDYYIEKEGK